MHNLTFFLVGSRSIWLFQCVYYPNAFLKSDGEIAIAFVRPSARQSSRLWSVSENAHNSWTKWYIWIEFHAYLF